MSAYFKNINQGIKTTLKGMSLTLKHFWNARRSRKPFAMQDSSYFDLKTGIVTLQYPHQTLPVPDNGRYQLDCEIDDCIVCDKCAKICPVDCIDIEPIKSSEVISYTSDGSPVRLYAAKFDIDMAKCCFCGLCTSVCPTECLTMTNEYDFSVIDITEMNFEFSNLSAEQADKKRQLYEQFLAEKEALKQSPQPTVQSLQPPVADKPKPTFKPSFKPTVKAVENIDNAERPLLPSDSQEITEKIAKPKPTFKPSFKAAVKTVENIDNEERLPLPTDPQEVTEKTAKPKPAVKTVENIDNAERPLRPTNPQEVTEKIAKPKPAFKPSFKPAVKTAKNTENQKVDKEQRSTQQSTVQSLQPPVADKPKPVFKPKLKITPKNK
jgi:formate hydrogenlyase subunit 6/NADH:ubiquinone oxidoreductase subunit I